MKHKHAQERVGWLIVVVMMISLIAGLVAGCQNPVETTGYTQTEPDHTSLDRKGTLSLNLATRGELESRTVTPSFDYNYVVIQLIPYQDTPFGAVTAEFSGKNKTVDVFPGDYRLETFLYAAADDPLPIARGSVEHVAIYAGQQTYATVTLKLVELTVDYTGQGTLTWTLPAATLMATMESAKIDITKGSSLVSTIDLLAQSTDKALNVGYYTLVATFKNIHGAVSKVMEVVWIYKNQQSVWELRLTGADFHGTPGTATINWFLDPGRDPRILTHNEEVESGSIIVWEIEDRGYSQIKWSIDAEPALDGTSVLYTLRTGDLQPGSHEVNVVVYGSDNIPRSASTRFVVKQKNQGYLVRNEAELLAALEAIASGSAGTAKIAAVNDFMVNPLVLGSGLAGKEITLTSSGSGKILSLASQGALFTLEPSTTLVVSNLTLMGRAENNNALLVLDNANLTLGQQSVLTGNTHSRFNDHAYGSAIYADGSRVEIKGGIIRENHIDSQATQIDKAGGAGTVYLSNSTLDFTEGSIENNTIRAANTNTGGGANGGGIAAYENSVIRMSGGKIRGNSIYAASSWWTAAKGSAIYVAGGSRFSMSGGVISGNHASTNIANSITGPWFGRDHWHELGAWGTVLSAEWDGLGIIAKSGGTIYGAEATGLDEDGYALRNWVADGSPRYGQAVYTGDLSEIQHKNFRDTTAGPDVHLDSTIRGPSGGWEN